MIARREEDGVGTRGDKGKVNCNIDREEEYEVEAILGHRGKPGHHTFLIQWKGYSTAEDTWEPEQNLGNA